MPTLQLSPIWDQWIWSQWSVLLKGEKILAPWSLPHPRNAGFRTTTRAWQVGQSADWALAVRDGSRIHIHEFPDGRLLMHRDRHDPDSGFKGIALHVLAETPVPAVALGVGLVVLLGRTAKA